MDNLRTDRMVDSGPTYYQFSQVYRKLQEAPAREYNTIDEANEDLRKQLYIPTATWGLMYWEQILGIRIIEADPYSIRRSRVLSRWRGYGQFSAALIRTVCEAYSNGEVVVTIDSDVNNIINITFIGAKGIPPNLEDLKEIVADIVHAHLGPAYSFTYLTWAELDAANKTWDQLDALGMTWAEFETWTP